RRQGAGEHAPALGRDEAPRPRRAGARASAAGDRPRRADRGRRRRAAADAVAVHRAAQPRRPHGPADDALPRGGRGAPRPHRDAEARPRRGAGPHLGAARRHREHDAALQARQAAAAAAHRQRARHRADRPAHGARCARGRVDPRRAARRRLRARGPRDRPRRPRGRLPRDHARRDAGAGGGMSATALPSPKTETGVLAGARTLLYKEVLRFWKVSFQTVAAPVLTAMLYLLIFGHVLEGRVKVFGTVGYTSFLIPGLVMMSVLQNAFANSSSSLIQSKITGNLVFLLVTPLSHWAWFVAYVGASVVRGAAVGAGVLLVTVWFAPLQVDNVLWIAFFTIAGAALMGALGLVAGLWAEKFDQIAAFQNFIIMPMTFLSGVFYSVKSLPPVWYEVSHLNPFFYMIDGFRHGFFGTSDVSPWTSFAVVLASLAVICAICLHLLRIGYKIRH